MFAINVSRFGHNRNTHFYLPHACISDRSSTQTVPPVLKGDSSCNCMSVERWPTGALPFTISLVTVTCCHESARNTAGPELMATPATIGHTDNPEGELRAQKLRLTGCTPWGSFCVGTGNSTGAEVGTLTFACATGLDQ